MDTLTLSAALAGKRQETQCSFKADILGAEVSGGKSADLPLLDWGMAVPQHNSTQSDHPLLFFRNLRAKLSLCP
jgi:hypothetical protein